MERLHYLAHYTAGEAREAIQGFLLLRTDEAYSKAKGKLMERYGNNFITAMTYKQRLRNWSVIKPGDGKALRQLADFLEGCEVASGEAAGLKVLGDVHENNILLRKLPKYIVDRWKRVVDTSVYESGEGHPSGYPAFSQFVSFLSKEARIACGPVSVQEGHNAEKNNQMAKQSRSDKVRAFATGTDASQTVQFCRVCKGQHTTKDCSAFKAMSIKRRHEAVKTHGLCRGCLKPGHIWKNCKKREKCETCNRWHPTLLHDDSFARTGSETGVKVSTEAATTLQVHTNNKEPQHGCSHAMIVPVRLEEAGKSEHRTVVYALLDLQYDACFITESTAQMIQADGDVVQLELSTMAGRSTMTCRVMKNLIVRPLHDDAPINMSPGYSRFEIPAERSLIPRAETARKWSHLADIATDIPPYMDDVEIGLLIGTSCGRAIKPREVRPGNDDDPWAVRTALGWGIIGPIGTACNSNSSCKLVQTSESQQRRCHVAFRTKVQEVSPSEVSRMFERDFKETTPDKEISFEDQLFVQKMSEGIHRTEEGHYEMPLPMKKQDAKLPNNRNMAMQRLQGLRRRLVRNDAFRREYTQCMQATLDKGYAEPVPAEELNLQNGRVWYIPHHSTVHRTKQKMRIVYDCSAEFGGSTLNSLLLQGPDMTNSLTGILCRFRMHPVAITCDMKECLIRLQ